MPETAAIVFTVDELWLLQRCIRHEISAQGTWAFPPANLDLNDQIAEALLRCTRLGLADAPLLLSKGDCLAIDYTVPADAKDANGKPLGRTVLLKSYEARDQILRGAPVAAEYSEPCTGAEARAWLAARPGKDASDARE